MGKKIVCFGGGSTVPKLILKPLKEKRFEVVGITSMVDSGKSSGALRREFGVLPPGDIRRHLIALANLPSEEEWKEKLWNFRFAKDIEIYPGYFGHNFANIFIAALEKHYNFEKALEILHEFLNIKKGKALPATLDKVQLIAELEDGSLIKGEDEIDIGENHDRTKRIKRIFLKPEAKGYQKTIEEIKKADDIIIGPGDLYTSILPCFLPKGIKEAIQENKGKKIFICPLMTKLGETQNFSVLDFSKEVEKYIGIKLDYIIYNNKIPKRRRIEKFKKERKFLIDLVSFENLPESEKYIGKDLIVKEGPIIHDSQKLLKLLISLI